MKQRYAIIKELAGMSNFKIIGNQEAYINGLNLCNRKTQYQSILGYTTNDKFFPAIIENSSLKALVISRGLLSAFIEYAGSKSAGYTYLVTDAPETTFYDIHNKLWESRCFYQHSQKAPSIGKDCVISNSAVVEDGTIIGDNVEIGPNSVIRSGSIIDDNVYIGCCSVIGSEGFQAIRGYNKMIKHVGGTHLCHDVYVGDNSTVGNALFEGCTEVGAYSKIDNHVHFAHNCCCGKGCIITACSLLMGSTVLENNVWLAPNAVILNGKTIKNGGFVGSMAFVNKDVEENQIVVGIPAKPLVKHQS